jgi:hypothetical protein
MTDTIDWRTGTIDIGNPDLAGETQITLSCWRETNRLERLLIVYRKALALAVAEGQDLDFRRGIKKLFDTKGSLQVMWNGEGYYERFHDHIARAWEDVGEHRDAIEHQDGGGFDLPRSPRPSEASPGFEKFGSALNRVLTKTRNKMDAGPDEK